MLHVAEGDRGVFFYWVPVDEVSSWSQPWVGTLELSLPLFALLRATVGPVRLRDVCGSFELVSALFPRAAVHLPPEARRILAPWGPRLLWSHSSSIGRCTGWVGSGLDSFPGCRASTIAMNLPVWAWSPTTNGYWLRLFYLACSRAGCWVARVQLLLSGGCALWVALARDYAGVVCFSLVISLSSSVCPRGA